MQHLITAFQGYAESYLAVYPTYIRPRIIFLGTLSSLGPDMLGGLSESNLSRTPCITSLIYVQRCIGTIDEFQGREAEGLQ